MGYIYKITNDVNGKIYVGKTELSDPNDRWKEHLKDYKKERYKTKILYKAMKKYGTEHFYFEVIEKTENKKESCVREQYWINKLHTYIGFDNCNGYNATLGGDGRFKLELDEQEIINYHKNEACYVLRKTVEHFNVSKTVIKKILLKNNISWIKYKDINLFNSYKEYGGVYQISPENKIVENIFENVSKANIFMGKKEYNKFINNACSGIKNGSHYAYGYLWYYGKDIYKIKNEIKFIY